MTNTFTHYGTPGMKWGVRKDRRTGKSKKSQTWTVKKKNDEIKEYERSKEGIAEYNRAVLKKARNYENRSKAFQEGGKIIGTAKQLERYQYASEKTRNIKEKLNRMSDAELKKEVQRMQLEQQYINMQVGNISKGRSYVRDALEVAGSLAATTGSILAIASSIQKLKER